MMPMPILFALPSRPMAIIVPVVAEACMDVRRVESSIAGGGVADERRNRSELIDKTFTTFHLEPHWIPLH